MIRVIFLLSLLGVCFFVVGCTSNNIEVTNVTENNSDELSQNSNSQQHENIAEESDYYPDMSYSGSLFNDGDIKHID
ncbi:hypothetical protein SMSP2_01802 [Limihaloglobus sulfuriphilus]|uniref:Uncharacterized protein n=1 Tax=Limihaloglobus sulfuriphilus TaxID=1851148 RepID=A0A1Q2MFV3_9BACT|nr:hypothetical protein SMSP2_01802 [Limihaloglobus sulfuriphilus]